MEEYTSACRFAVLNGIGDMDGRLADEPHITIHSAMIGKVELSLFLAWRKTLVIAVVGFDGYETLVTRLDTLGREIDGNRQITAKMLLNETAVDVYPLFAHDSLEVQFSKFALHVGGHHEVLTIPANTLIVAASAGF